MGSNIICISFTGYHHHLGLRWCKGWLVCIRTHMVQCISYRKKAKVERWTQYRYLRGTFIVVCLRWWVKQWWMPTDNLGMWPNRGSERGRKKTVNQNSTSSLWFASGSVPLNSFFCFMLSEIAKRGRCHWGSNKALAEGISITRCFWVSPGNVSRSADSTIHFTSPIEQPPGVCL